MKDVRYIRKEKGVSPVIATILMVAITVVLAATVYIMVSMYTKPTTVQIQGALMYDSISSNPAKGWANFTVQMSQPANGVNLTKLKVTVGGTTYTWGSGVGKGIPDGSTIKVGIIDANGDGNLNNGEYIYIYISGQDISGQKVIVAASGFSGTLAGTIGS